MRASASTAGTVAALKRLQEIAKCVITRAARIKAVGAAGSRATAGGAVQSGGYLFKEGRADSVNVPDGRGSSV